MDHCKLTTGPGDYVVFLHSSSLSGAGGNVLQVGNRWTFRVAFQDDLSSVSLQQEVLPLLRDLLLDSISPDVPLGSANPILKPAGKFQITFSLLVEDPETSNIKGWNISKAVDSEFLLRLLMQYAHTLDRILFAISAITK